MNFTKSHNNNLQLFYFKYLKSNLFTYSIFLVTIISILPSIPNLKNTYIFELGFEIMIFLFLLVNKKSFADKSSKKTLFWVNIYLTYNFINFLRGLIISENYWDFKNTFVNSMGLFVPIICYYCVNEVFLQTFFKKYLLFSLPLFFLFLFIIVKDSYGFYLVPISFLGLFWPIIKKPWNYIILCLSILIVVADLGARSNVIKFFIPLVFASFIYMYKYFSKKIIEFLRLIFLFAPFVLLLITLFTGFNIFKIGDSFKGDLETESVLYNGAQLEVQNVNLKDDTRTFLYEEVLYSANKLNFWIFGRSPARGNISLAFGGNDPANRNERSANEVCILNIFVWTGIVGVLIYFIIFYQASYLAINRSNNIYSVIVGLYLSFRWVYAWVEDINIFGLTNIFVWVTIAFCYSSNFRSMNNAEVNQWVNGIFNFRKLYKRFN